MKRSLNRTSASLNGVDQRSAGTAVEGGAQPVELDRVEVERDRVAAAVALVELHPPVIGDGEALVDVGGAAVDAVAEEDLGPAGGLVGR